MERISRRRALILLIIFGLILSFYSGKLVSEQLIKNSGNLCTIHAIALRFENSTYFCVFAYSTANFHVVVLKCFCVNFHPGIAPDVTCSLHKQSTFLYA